MSKDPSPKLDSLRAMREQQFEEEAKAAKATPRPTTKKQKPPKE
jgi:hypothetical protein